MKPVKRMAAVLMVLVLIAAVANAEVVLIGPANEADFTQAPAFSWSTTSSYDAFFFIGVFYYDLGTWTGYYPAKFSLRQTGFQMPETWWDKVGDFAPSFWTVLAINTTTHEWDVADPWWFMKVVGVSELSRYDRGGRFIEFLHDTDANQPDPDKMDFCSQNVLPGLVQTNWNANQPWSYTLKLGAQGACYKFKATFPGGYDSFSSWRLYYTTDDPVTIDGNWQLIDTYEDPGFRGVIQKLFALTPANTSGFRWIVDASSRGIAPMYDPDLGGISIYGIEAE